MGGGEQNKAGIIHSLWSPEVGAKSALSADEILAIAEQLAARLTRRKGNGVLSNEGTMHTPHAPILVKDGYGCLHIRGKILHPPAESEQDPDNMSFLE